MTCMLGVCALKSESGLFLPEFVMAEVRIKCPCCGEILSADDKYLRYTVGCGKCHHTFIFDSICIDGNQGTIPVFPPVTDLAERKMEFSEKEQFPYESLNHVKVGRIAKAVFFYALRNNLCSDDELAELMSEEKSRELFHFGYPLFVSVPIDSMDKSALLVKGHCRYYREPVCVGKNAIFVCSQWYDYNRAAMLLWAYQHHISLETIKSCISADASEQDYLDLSGISCVPSDGRNTQIKENLSKDSAAFFKTFNKSVFVVGITIPNELRSAFLEKLSVDSLECGKSHNVKIKLDGQIFEAHVLKANQKNGCYFWRLQWSNGSPIAVYLQNKYPNIYQNFELNKGQQIPENCGVLVSATEELDVFSMTCIGNDDVESALVSPGEESKDDDSPQEADSETEKFTLASPPRNLTYTKPKSIWICDGLIATSSWKSVLVEVCKYIFQKDPDNLLLFCDEENAFKATSRICFSRSPEKMKSPVQISTDLWLETNFSANNIIDLSTELFEFSDIPLSEVTLVISRARKNDIPSGSMSETSSGSITSGDSDFDQMLDQWGEENL